MGLWGMGVYRDMMGVVGTFELMEGFDVAGGGGASEARGNLSSRCGRAGAEEVSTASHLFLQCSVLHSFYWFCLKVSAVYFCWDCGQDVVVPCLPIDLHRFLLE